MIGPSITPTWEIVINVLAASRDVSKSRLKPIGGLMAGRMLHDEPLGLILNIMALFFPYTLAARSNAVAMNPSACAPVAGTSMSAVFMLPLRVREECGEDIETFSSCQHWLCAARCPKCTAKMT